MTEETKYLIKISFEDGCIFIMDSLTDQDEIWELTFPGGFIIKCPHGFIDSTHSIAFGE